MVNIAIVEDEEHIRGKLLDFMERYRKEQSLELSVTVFPNGEQFLREETKKYDIAFLDIEMPGRNGMETAAELRKRGSEMVLVFVTNMAQYAIRGYEVDALDFVLKPLSYYSFAMKLKRALERLTAGREEQLLIRTQNGMQLLSPSDILYLETLNRYLYFHTLRGDFRIRESMMAMEEKLAARQFARCNQSYLVNLRYVEGVDGNMVVLQGGVRLEISRRNKNQFMDTLLHYYGGTE